MEQTSTTYAAFYLECYTTLQRIQLADLISIAGKGHVRVENPAAWKLSGGYPLNDTAQPAAEEYTMSLFHQLHCLVSARPYMNDPTQYC